jgi:hypothetical protein
VRLLAVFGSPGYGGTKWALPCVNIVRVAAPRPKVPPVQMAWGRGSLGESALPAASLLAAQNLRWFVPEGLHFGPTGLCCRSTLGCPGGDGRRHNNQCKGNNCMGIGSGGTKTTKGVFPRPFHAQCNPVRHAAAATAPRNSRLHTRAKQHWDLLIYKLWPKLWPKTPQWPILGPNGRVAGLRVGCNFPKGTVGVHCDGGPVILDTPNGHLWKVIPHPEACNPAVGP